MTALGLAVAIGTAWAAVSRENGIPRRLLVVSGSRLPTHELVLLIRSATGRRERFVTRLGSSLGDPAWSPNASRFAWTDWRGVHAERADGSGHRLLVKSPCPYSTCANYSFAWSPDGRSLVVGGAGRIGDRLVIASAETGKSTDVTPAQRRRGCISFGDPTCVQYAVIGWQRRTIAYETNTQRAGSPADSIWVMGKDRKHPRLLRTFKDPIHDSPYAALSPDGSTVALVTEHRDPGDAAFGPVDTATRELHVVRVDAGLEKPVWSPDGRLAVSTPSGIVILGARGTHRYSLHVRGAGLVWTRSDDLLFRRDADLFVSDGGRRPPRLLFRAPGIRSFVPNW